MHAKPFFPFMFRPSDPQTPSRQERRNDSDGSFFQLDQRIQQHHVATFFRFKGVILHVRSVVNIRL